MTNYFQKIDPYEVSLAGRAFAVSASYSFSGNQTKYLQINTGAEKAPMLMDFKIASSVEPLRVSLVEAPTITNGTTAVVAYNLNRLSATTATLTAFSDPTSVSSGTTLHVDLCTAGSKAGANASDSHSWTLKKNTKYVLKMEQLTNQSTSVTVELVFAEGVGTSN